jgi:hypothetical protein
MKKLKTSVTLLLIIIVSIAKGQSVDSTTFLDSKLKDYSNKRVYPGYETGKTKDDYLKTNDDEGTKEQRYKTLFRKNYFSLIQLNNNDNSGLQSNKSSINLESDFGDTKANANIILKNDNYTLGFSVSQSFKEKPKSVKFLDLNGLSQGSSLSFFWQKSFLPKSNLAEIFNQEAFCKEIDEFNEEQKNVQTIHVTKVNV